jgi:hypothetical protein
MLSTSHIKTFFSSDTKKNGKKGWAFENQNACQSAVMFSRLPVFHKARFCQCFQSMKAS